MLKNMVDYHDKAQAAISANPELTWAKIKEHTADVIFGLSQQKVSIQGTRVNLVPTDTFPSKSSCTLLTEKRATRPLWTSSTLKSTRRSARCKTKRLKRWFTFKKLASCRIRTFSSLLLQA